MIEEINEQRRVAPQNVITSFAPRRASGYAPSGWRGPMDGLAVGRETANTYMGGTMNPSGGGAVNPFTGGFADPFGAANPTGGGAADPFGQMAGNNFMNGNMGQNNGMTGMLQQMMSTMMQMMTSMMQMMMQQFTNNGNQNNNNNVNNNFGVNGRPNGLNEIQKTFGAPGTNQVTTQMPAGPGGKMVSVTCNKAIADRMKAAFEEIKSSGLSNLIHSFDGSFNNRSKRGGSSKSTHAWGISFDVNASENPMGSSKMTAGQRQLAAIFSKYGFYQLPNDPMHFQFCTGY